MTYTSVDHIYDAVCQADVTISCIVSYTRPNTRMMSAPLRYRE